MVSMSKKHAYITTAIPYANAKPHIGNAMDYVLADIWARYQNMLGRQVRFQVGLDEHGNKVAQKAAENGQTPQQFVDGMLPEFEAMIHALGVEYTDFIRTSDPHHVAAVQKIWLKLQPYIYKGSYEGWYCVGCEAYVTDKEAAENNGVCSDHNKPYERLSEENYYFKMSAFAEKIKAAIESKKMQIYPEFREKEILMLIESGLQDVSVSRPKKSLSWGVPVPGDENQVMYVWIDALSNYITVLGYPDNPEWQDYWPADVQVIGKDILRFHAAIWPAILMGLDLPLPKKLLVHGHINVDGAKMSKSVGNVVDPIEIINEYGLDAFRYYFSRHVPTLDDGDFTWEKFERAYNGELANDLGNLVSRVAKMVLNYQAGVYGEADHSQHDAQAYHDAMERLQFDEALDEAWLMIRSLNAYLDQVRPWHVAKTRDTNTEAESHLQEILAHCVGTLIQVAYLVAPFLPFTAQAILDTFKDGTVVAEPPILFPKKELYTGKPADAPATH